MRGPRPDAWAGLLGGAALAWSAELQAWDVGPGATGRAEPLDAGERDALRELGYLE